jgi:acyl-CoA reductase-like NAD-dependent aldehyde dehydrogenase
MTTADTPAAVPVQRAAQQFAFEPPTIAHFIDGEHSEAAPHGTAEIRDPARGTVLAELPLGGQDEVDAAVAAARKAAPAWGKRTPGDRSALLLQLADALEADTPRLRTLEALNCGKPAAVTEDDIASTIDTFRFMAGAGRSGTTVGAGEYVEDITSLILREPLGVIGMVTPWNYPLLMVAWKLAPALMVGNTVVLKPSEVTSLTTLRLVELARDILPAGVLNVVHGTGETVGRAISAHPGIDMAALTGSVRAGRDVARNAAENLTRTHLELGGKAPVLVLPDADLELAAETVFEAGFWNSGQECGAACRVIAHESIADEFARLLTGAVERYALADPEAEAEHALGPIIYREHCERVLTAIEEAVERGAQVLTGGRGDATQGYWVQPTVLRVAEGDPITYHEVFGPVVSLETYTDEADAIARANAVEYGLAGSVFTRDVATAMTVSKALDFGSVNVNTHLALPTEMPWSGFKHSGHGRDLSAYALDDYARTKHVAIHHGK